MSGQPHASDAARPRAGTRVAGRYRLEHEIGRGGMGVVWYAVDEVLERPVAVKQVTIPPSIAPREAEVLRERVVREARAAGRVRHDSAVTVYDVVDEDGTPYLVMEMLDARSLAQLVRDDGPLTPRETARVGLAVLGALEAAHAVGVVHRDVKPGNVLVADDGRVMLTDFGIASSQGDPTITATGLLLGSPAYIPPERARGTAGGPSSDIWSLAATLWTAVEGRPAYDGDGPVAILTAVVEGRRHEPVRGGALAPVLVDVLDADADSRPSVPALRTALERVAETASDDVPDVTPVTAQPGQREQTQVLAALSGAPKPTRPKQRPPSPHVRRRRIALAAVVAAGVAAGIAGWQLGGSGGSSIPLTTFHAQNGWTVGVPDGWVPAGFPDKSWREPGSFSTYVQIQVGEGANAKQSLTNLALGKPTKVGGFRQLSLTGDADQATLEWLEDTTSGAQLHLRDTYTEAGGKTYAFVEVAGAKDWAAAQKTFSAIRKSFRTS
ncbi:MAG TPA: serine/threonine-protein kinase [Mycobacteriales bacterium]|nr:serine/threonine-protein kinase [Mycobacteriales bacterium]